MSASAAPSSVHTTSAPDLDEDEARELVRAEFGIAGTTHLLTSERDRNFHIAADDGRAFVLKVGNAAEDVGVSDFQTRALRRIAERAPGLPVPVVQPSVGGDLQIVARIRAGSRHVIRLLSFLPGTPLHRTMPSPRQTRNLGRCLAEIGIALDGFAHPAARHDLIWDLQRADRLRPHLRHIADAGLRRLSEAGLDVFEREVQPRMREFRRQVVHNDFNPHNVLMDSADANRVTGVLDFGDMVETPLINDVAVAASYQAEGDDILGRVVDFVSAYHGLRALAAEELDVLFDLVVLRQAMTLAITEWRSSLHPENRAYILRNHPRAAAALVALDGIGRSEGRSRLRDACLKERDA